MDENRVFYDPEREAQRRAQQEEEKKALCLSRALQLEKWMRLLFWLVIGANIVGLFSSDTMAEIFPVFYWIITVFSSLCGVLYALILWKMSKIENLYQSAAYCALAGTALALVGAIISFGILGKLLALLLSLPGVVFTLAGEYREYMAHAAVLEGIDPELPTKWRTLWKLYIGFLLAAFCAAFLVIFPLIGGLVLIGSIIGLLVVSIMKLVYLYRSAEALRIYPRTIKKP
ncbi:MAG: hypothetical protein IJ333_03280 [Clostridia bacterium]|nr:hypothetical protein [Clostridia bacterium]